MAQSAATQMNCLVMLLLLFFGVAYGHFAETKFESAAPFGNPFDRMPSEKLSKIKVDRADSSSQLTVESLAKQLETLADAIQPIMQRHLEDTILSKVEDTLKNVGIDYITQGTKDTLQNGLAHTITTVHPLMPVVQMPPENGIVHLMTSAYVSLMKIVQHLISSVNLRKAKLVKASGLLVGVFFTSIFVNTNVAPVAKTMPDALTLRKAWTNLSGAANKTKNTEADKKATADKAAAKKAAAKKAADEKAAADNIEALEQNMASRVAQLRKELSLA